MNHAISSDDKDFKERIETCTFPISDFDHRSHLRLAYVSLTENSTENSVSFVREALNRLLRHNNIEPSSKYHETLTKAWILAVKHFMENSEAFSSADEFINNNPGMLDSQIMMTHYTHDSLFSDKARKMFIEPDLEAIPTYG